jgi:hypothetical protein
LRAVWDLLFAGQNKSTLSDLRLRQAPLRTDTQQQVLSLKIMNNTPPDHKHEYRPPMDDAHFAIVVLAVASLTLIIFVLLITLWMS